MAEIDRLLEDIKDEALRQNLQREVGRLRDVAEFGLVFERHLPEEVRLYGQPVLRGSTVVDVTSAEDREWLVTRVAGNKAQLLDRSTLDHRECDIKHLVVVRHFGEPIYPGLTSLGRVERGGDKPFHTVIEAENYHALEMLAYAYEAEFDAIYLDPPYNTGARDWKYNNDYVDSNDSYRHSKWLSFMERRLRLAKRLLSANGVLIVAIDANETHRLALLLESIFPAALIQMVTVVVNPSGKGGEGFSVVDEYLFFCFLGSARPVANDDNFLTGDGTGSSALTWESLLRRGNTWYRESRPNLCYPVKIDPKTRSIVGVGRRFEGEDESKRPTSEGDVELAWPVRTDGRLGIWRTDGDTLMKLAGKGYACASSKDLKRNTWTIRYLLSGTVDAIDAGEIKVTRTGKYGEVVSSGEYEKKSTAKTVWYRGRHNAGTAGGTVLVTELLGERNLFTYPKSLYAVEDALRVAIGDRQDAKILDFFAGSGTTLHAVTALNAADDGLRSCVLVTNNEVREDVAATLASRGVLPGSAEFESQGIYYRVTRPRIEAAVNGCRADGSALKGEYLDGRPLQDGYAENVDFMRLDYLDPDPIAAGQAFHAIAPLLWLKAGAVGDRLESLVDTWWATDTSTYAVLFDTSLASDFVQRVATLPRTRVAYVVTDSNAVFQQVASELPDFVQAVQLYTDYLTNFQINHGDDA